MEGAPFCTLTGTAKKSLEKQYRTPLRTLDAVQFPRTVRLIAALPHVHWSSNLKQNVRLVEGTNDN